MKNQHIKEQFNRQAEKFASWSVGKNIEYLKAYFVFCEMSKDDNLLDVACGPGEFTIYTAKQISLAHGVDISDKQIELANGQKKELGLTNVNFDCSDVEHLPYKDNTFSIVISKSSFHHFIQPDIIFKEMKRCCKPGGRISIQDIVAYDDNYVNDFFETFDKLVDVSHNRVLSDNEINVLCQNNGIKKIKEFKLDVHLNVNEYIGHAVQDSKSSMEIDRLLLEGQKDKKLADYLYTRNGELYYKRYVYLILGIKE